MKIKLNENEDLELVYSFRTNIYFEQIQGKNIDFSNFTANDLITLFYCVFLSSLQKVKKPTISMMDFMDIIDDNGGDKCIIEFSNWYVGILQNEFEVINSMSDEKDNKVKPASKKKN